MEAFKENQRVVILGAPCSGKTTFVKYLMLAFIRKPLREQLELDEDRLPILTAIGDVAGGLSSDRSIVDVLSKRINAEFQLDLPDGYFLPYLEAGRCIVLFDGLDEIVSIRQRNEVRDRIRLFVTRYPENHYVITSRAAGYREIQRLPEEDGFTHFVVRDLDDNQIGDFARRWYTARYPVEPNSRTEELIAALKRNPRVKQLARSPLMLTIIAMFYRSYVELPNEKMKLYDYCTDTLLFAWPQERGFLPPKDINDREIRDREVRSRLERLAYWMHSQILAKSSGHNPFRRSDLVDTTAEQLVDRRKMDDRDEATSEAEAFLQYVSQDIGIIQNRDTDAYAFSSETFREYFSAWDICRRCGGTADNVWSEISQYWYERHWREVIRLVVTKLDNEFYEFGEELISEILKAEVPREELENERFLVAGECLADNVEVDDDTCYCILSKLVDMATCLPHSAQREDAISVLRRLANSRCREKVIDRLLALLPEEDRASIDKDGESIVGKLLLLIEQQ